MADDSEQGVGVSEQPPTTTEQPDHKEHTPIQRANPTPFPVQNLPPEVQVMVLTAAIRKPSIHFADLELRLFYHKSLWTVILRPMRSSMEDSAFHYQKAIRSLCSAGRQAFHQSTIRPINIRLGGVPSDKHIVDGNNDLICLGRLPKCTENNHGIPYYTWNPDQSAVFPVLNFYVIGHTFEGLRKIGLVRDFEGDAGREYHTCRPESVAWFLDNCPHLEEFYIVLPLRRDSPALETIRKWSQSRESATTICFCLSVTILTSVLSTGPKDPSLSVFHGKTKSYVEVHNPFTFDTNDYNPDELVGGRYLKFRKVGCTCPLAPRCSGCPKFGLGINPKFVFMRLWEIRWHLLREDLNSQKTPWILSRARRESIKFGLLIQDVDF
jgi:hypothetical protein